MNSSSLNAYASWRLMYSPPASGAWNMALDEAILENAVKLASPPTLRLYSWQPACLSLGYAQPAGDVDTVALQHAGYDLVRRPTGGRAILHVDELTYSVIGPSSEPRLAGSVLECYQRLSTALLEALRRLGISAAAHKPGGIPPAVKAAGPVCFEVPSNYEITSLGKKLIGSAQARRLGGVLQHGSLPLCGDLTRITRVLKFENEQARQQAAERLLAHATTAENVTGIPLAWEIAAMAFQQAFQDTFQIPLVLGEPTNIEIDRANQLVEIKYAADAWNLRI